MTRNRLPSEARSPTQGHLTSVRSASSISPRNQPPRRPKNFGALVVSAVWRRPLLWLCIPLSVYAVLTTLQVFVFTPDIQITPFCAGEMQCLMDMQSNTPNRRRRPLDRVFRPLSPLGRSRMFRPNYGDLNYRPNNASTLKITIQDRDTELYNQERFDILADMDSRVRRNDADYDHYDDLDWPQKCYRARSTYIIRPSCNDFHERPVGDTDPSRPSKYLGRGFYRMSWSLPDFNDTGVVLKNQRLKEDEDEDYNPIAFSAQVQVEALNMERTTFSDRTTDIYGHCGMSIFVELASPIERSIIREYSYGEPISTVDSNKHGDVQTMNTLTPEQKLAVALAMAEGLALLHGNFDGVIVNDDIQLNQWLLGRDGKVKLNDFNKAVIMQWNPEKQSYCPFRSQYLHTYRSPEQLIGNKPVVDEKADMFAFGHILYTLLTGLVPFYERGSRDEALKANYYGGLPFVDPRYRNRSLIERRLVEIMGPCYQHKPEDRISIFEVVAHLRETVRMYDERYSNATRIAVVSLLDIKEESLA